MAAMRAKKLFLVYPGRIEVTRLFMCKKNISKRKMNILWDSYLEFMVVKTLGLDPGNKNQIKYGATASIENLWHFHVSMTDHYENFMLIVQDINPLVGYIAHPLDFGYSSREKKQKRRKNTIEAYRYSNLSFY